MKNKKAFYGIDLSFGYMHATQFTFCVSMLCCEMECNLIRSCLSSDENDNLYVYGEKTNKDDFIILFNDGTVEIADKTKVLSIHCDSYRIIEGFYFLCKPIPPYNEGLIKYN